MEISTRRGPCGPAWWGRSPPPRKSPSLSRKLSSLEPTLRPPAAGGRYGLEAESLPGELAEDISSGRRSTQAGADPGLGREVPDGLSAAWGTCSATAASGHSAGSRAATPARRPATGLLSVEPRQNRFGNEFLLNQIGLVIQKPLKQDRFDLGFNMRYFAGADAALGQPKGGIGYPPGNPHFGQDFRDLYLSAHLPILTEGGMDVKVGRMNTIIGYNGFLAPYRPFYSSDYQFFYSQDGAFTGFLTDLHVNDRLDIWNGMTLGANTFFTMRSNNSYLLHRPGQLLADGRTEDAADGARSTAGPNAIFAAPGLAGNFDTMVELRLQQNWSEHFTQIIQINMGWDANTPVGTGSWYGLYLIGIYHLSAKSTPSFVPNGSTTSRAREPESTPTMQR